MCPARTRPRGRRSRAEFEKSLGVQAERCCSLGAPAPEGMGHLGGCAPAAFDSRPACWRNDGRTLYLLTTPTAREVSEEVGSSYLEGTPTRGHPAFRVVVVPAAGTLLTMSDVTRLIDAAASGDRQAAADLLPLVYAELRRLAAARLARE